MNNLLMQAGIVKLIKFNDVYHAITMNAAGKIEHRKFDTPDAAKAFIKDTMGFVKIKLEKLN